MKRIRLTLRQTGATAAACAKQALDGGVLASFAEFFVRFAQFAAFILLWRGFAAAGVDLGGFTPAALFTYTFASNAFRRQLEILTPATSMMWEGSIVGRYTRPMPVYASFISETVGRQWAPNLLFYTLPLIPISLLLGVNPLPASFGSLLLFLLSLSLSIPLGFAIDLLFASLALRMKNAMWMVNRIREAVYNLLSGALIPFALFPTAVGRVFSLLPFGSVANAPLLLYVGMGQPLRLLVLQCMWVLVLWPIAHWAYKKSEERMVSYGG